MSTVAEIIDDYFRQKNGYAWVPYEDIGKILVEEVDRQGPNGLYYSTAAALLEQETHGKNIMGCDWGSKWTDTPPYCQVAVTKDRVQKLIANVEAGGGQNGIGLTQLTSINYVYAAEKMGGAHLPRYQMRVGFDFLLTMIQDIGWPHGAAAYNAGLTNYWSVMNTYGASMKRLEREWAARLANAKAEPEEPEPDAERFRIFVRTPVKTRAEARKIRDGIERQYGVDAAYRKIGGGKGGNVSKLEEALGYGLKLNERRPKYWCWDGGSLDRTVGGRPGCVDGPPPPMAEIRNIFCADLLTLMMRHIGKPVPKNGPYPGGTRSFQINYGSKMVPFKISEFRRGDVAFVDFQERGPNFEGHIGVCLGGPDDPFLQSFAWNCRDLEPGLNADWTLRQSHDGGYYTHRLPREAIWG